jgi:hypothetical protein
MASVCGIGLDEVRRYTILFHIERAFAGMNRFTVSVEFGVNGGGRNVGSSHHISHLLNLFESVTRTDSMRRVWGWVLNAEFLLTPRTSLLLHMPISMSKKMVAPVRFELTLPYS